MSNAVTLMKIFGFIALVSGLIVMLASDPNFKGLDVYRTNWEGFTEQLGNNPLGDRPPDISQGGAGSGGGGGGGGSNGDEFGAASTRWCLIQEFCPDIPLWSDLVDSTIGTGAAILAWARTFATFVTTIFSFIGWIADMAWKVLTILVLAITFTIPGIPIFAQMLLWVVNLSMWVAMIYIAFQSITGAVSGAMPF